MSIKLKYVKGDKTPDAGGWILDYVHLMSIKDEIDKMADCSIDCNLETIEAVLLIANGEVELLKQLNNL